MRSPRRAAGRDLTAARRLLAVTPIRVGPGRQSRARNHPLPPRSQQPAAATRPVAGTLLQADGTVTEARTLTVDPVDKTRITLTIDGRRVAGQPPWRIHTRD